MSAEWLNHDRVQIKLKGLKSLFWKQKKSPWNVAVLKCSILPSFHFDAWKHVNRKAIRLQLPVTGHRAAAGQWQSEMIPKLLWCSVDLSMTNVTVSASSRLPHGPHLFIDFPISALLFTNTPPKSFVSIKLDTWLNAGRQVAPGNCQTQTGPPVLPGREPPSVAPENASPLLWSPQGRVSYTIASNALRCAWWCKARR